MEKKYQIFISSTLTDLREERKDLIFQILDCEHFPIGMEMFKPSDKKQWETIKRAIDSSDIYFLIIGFRYGSKDSDGISYTEKEFDYAKANGIPIIVFVLEESKYINDINTISNLQLKGSATEDEITKLEHIYKEHFDKEQADITAFKKKVMGDRLVKFFPHGKIHVQAAIDNAIKKLPNGGWVQQKKSKWNFLSKINFYVILVLLIITTGFVYFFSGIGTIQHKLIVEDEALFYSPKKDATLEYARVLPDDGALKSESNLPATLRATTNTFWMFTNAFKAFYENEDIIDSCLKRGVDFRILLVDTASEKLGGLNQNWVYQPDSIGAKAKKNKLMADFSIVLNHINTLRKKISDSSYKGQVHVRLYRKPMIYQLWIKDANHPDCIAHCAVIHFDDFKPIFRVSYKTSLRLTKGLIDEYNKYWTEKTNTIVFD